MVEEGNSDVGGKGDVSFPFLNDLVVSVNVESKAITVDAKRLGEVAVYED